MSEPREPTPEEWHAIFTRVFYELSACVNIGTLAMPLHILITDGRDRTVSDFEVSRDPEGKVDIQRIAPEVDTLKSGFVFPVTHTATDRNGKEWEAVLTAEDANRLLRVS